MAAGDVHVCAKFVSNMAALAGGKWTNAVKVALITNAVTPSISDTDPRWGVGGAQNYSTAEVTAGGNYSAGGIPLSGLSVAGTFPNVDLVATSPISVTANAANPTGAFWGIIYDSTSAGKEVLGFIDLGGPVSLVNGLSLNINSQPSGAQPLLRSTSA